MVILGKDLFAAKLFCPSVVRIVFGSSPYKSSVEANLGISVPLLLLLEYSRSDSCVKICLSKEFACVMTLGVLPFLWFQRRGVCDLTFAMR